MDDPALLDSLIEAGCPTEYVDPVGFSAHHLLAQAPEVPLSKLNALGPPRPDTMPCTSLAYLCAARIAEDPAFRDYIREHDLDLTGYAGRAAQVLMDG